jgi:hypothetical protein
MRLGDKWGHYNAECTSLLRGRRWRRPGSWISDETQPARVSPPRMDYPHIKTLVESDSFRPIQALDSSTSGVRGPPAHKNLDAREDQPYSSRPMHRIGRCILSPPTSTPRSPNKATRRFMGVSHFKEMVITAPLE